MNSVTAAVRHVQTSLATARGDVLGGTQARQRQRSLQAKHTLIIIIIIIISVVQLPLNGLAIELVQEIGRRITAITEDARETVFLFQRLSMALQQGNAVAFQNTMSTE